MSAGHRINTPPGWPSPPRGWIPPAGWQPDPSWPPAPPGWQWWVADPYAPDWDLGDDAPLRRRRNSALRLLFTVLIVLVPTALAFIVALAAAATIDPNDYATDAAYERAVSDVTDPLTAVAALGGLVLYALLARRVSYRWFDTFMQLIPFYGIFFVFRIAWRVSNLPYRDWTPREEERLAEWRRRQAWEGASNSSHRLSAPTARPPALTGTTDDGDRAGSFVPTTGVGDGALSGRALALDDGDTHPYQPPV